MCLIMLCPIAATYEVFLHDAYYKYIPSTNNYYLYSGCSSPDLLKQLFYFMCVCLSLTTVSNCFVFAKLCLFPLTPRNLETEFFFVSFMSSNTLTIGTVLTYGMRSATPGTLLFEVNKILLPVVSDVLSLNQPFYLIFYHKPARKLFFDIIHEVFRCLCCRKPRGIRPVDVTIL
ncbi:hypothetical protein L5515_018556 [Caenorhabditis briggsae]|uniref:Serpentine receptor class gamma n=1 Tax=Caenorhabditis briggsae TaxID=6238 RepID=A0AAE9JSU0_CAEBR|nr:hypothetical protein L5515_018556 [Caenorhabditis briggsae]